MKRKQPKRDATAEDLVAFMTACFAGVPAEASAIIHEVEPYSLIAQMTGAFMASIQLNAESRGEPVSSWLQRAGLNVASSTQATDA